MRDNNEESSLTLSLIFIIFCMMIVSLAAHGFLYILEIQMPFWKVFIAFVLCTVVVKWFKAMWSSGQ